MLATFTFSDFKSFREARLPLGPLTVLIGANAAGKSNAIEALRLLSWLAQGQKLSSIQYAVNSADRDVRLIGTSCEVVVRHSRICTQPLRGLVHVVERHLGI